MAREVASRISPRTGTLHSSAGSLKAARKSEKKAARGDRTGPLVKAFTGAIAIILLPALLLVLRHLLSTSTRSSHAERSTAADLGESAVVSLSASVVDFRAERLAILAHFAAEHPEGALVEFYMPDCEHCKKLAPEYEAAAKEVAASGGPPFASLNGEAYPEVAKQHGVFRYPTVLWFRQGEAVQELRPTSRTKEKIMEFVDWVQQPPFTEFETRDELEEAVPHLRQALNEKSPPVIVGFATSEVKEALERVGERLRGKALFLYVKERAEDTTDKDADVASLRRYSASAESDSFFTGAVSPESVQKWVESLLPTKKEKQ